MPTIIKPDNIYIQSRRNPLQYQYTKSLECCSTPQIGTRTIIKNNNCCYNKVVRTASTVIQPNYYTSSSQYLQSKCKTYSQNQVSYNRNANGIGRPDCQSSNQSCNRNTYNPDNKKFSKQGAVSASERLLRLKYDTIESSYTSTGQRYRGNIGGQQELVKDSTCCNPNFIYRNSANYGNN